MKTVTSLWRRRLGGTGLLAFLALVVPRVALAEDPCRTVDFEGVPFTVCEASAQDDIRLWLRDDAGRLIGAPGRVARVLAPGERLVFAMNAGMYDPAYDPVGLFVQDGHEVHRLSVGAGDGNFGMVPNGVFCVGDRLRVIETRAFQAERPACRYATQSGPMLVIDGALHPRFIPDSDSTYIRNGVGVSPDGERAWFVISDRAVNFHRFARFFRDVLGARDALYLDGSVSRLSVPGQGRSDLGFSIGPIIGVVAR